MRNSKDTRTAVGADQDHLAPLSLSFGGRRRSRRYWDDARRVKQLVPLYKPVRPASETYLDDLTSFIFLKVSDRRAVSGSIRLALPCAVATNSLIKLDAGAAVASPLGNHLNFGTAGAVMLGGASGATLEAFPIPLGSTNISSAPIVAAFGRLPPKCPIAAEPACPPPCPPRANEAAGAVKTMNNAKATFTEVLDMGEAPL
jgi:hypothetical protein